VSANSNATEKPAKRAAPASAFKPGQSGNPSGRPKTPAELVELARGYSKEAIKTAGEILRDTMARPADRIRAAELLLDRGYGKAPQDINIGGQADNPLEIKTDMTKLSDGERMSLIEMLSKVTETSEH